MLVDTGRYQDGGCTTRFLCWGLPRSRTHRRGWAEWVQRPLAHSRVSAQLFLPMQKAECAAKCCHFSKETGNLHFYINSLHSKYEQPIQNPPRAKLLCLNCASQKKSCPQPQGSPACDRV